MGAPADAIREFLNALDEAGVAVYRGDLSFAKALRPVTAHVRQLRFAKATALDHDLDGWWRIKFSSRNVDRADLRIVCRVTVDSVELRAFGLRHDPESIYRKSVQR